MSSCFFGVVSFALQYHLLVDSVTLAVDVAALRAS